MNSLKKANANNSHENNHIYLLLNKKNAFDCRQIWWKNHPLDLTANNKRLCFFWGRLRALKLFAEHSPSVYMHYLWQHNKILEHHRLLVKARARLFPAEPFSQQHKGITHTSEREGGRKRV